MRKMITAMAVFVLVTTPSLGQTKAKEPEETTPALAQVKAQDLEETVDSTVEIRRQTQERMDQWDAQRTELVGRYRAARANVDYLTQRREIAEERLAALHERVAELERRLKESSRLAACLQDTLVAILRRVDCSVAHDLPFLAAERATRLASLKDDLARPDVTPAEKLRHLLEVLQIEAQYGGTVEVYQDRITVAGDSLCVDLLQLGRLSIFWRTPDGKRVGEYDRAIGQWVELPRKYRRPIDLAMEIATHRRPIGLVALPLGRLVP